MSTQIEMPELRPARAVIRLALAGNPNSGKTSLFNALTGTHQQVGNYPGVTVEKRVGSLRTHDRRFELLDLPGTYSLSSYSPEERIAQAELLDPSLDVVVLVADTTMLRRSLVLLAQVLQTSKRVVLALNMSDEAHAAGQRLDVEKMRDLLGIPVVETVAHRGRGVRELIEAVESSLNSEPSEPRIDLDEQLQFAIQAIRAQLDPDPRADWFATRLLVGDPEMEAAFADRSEAIDEAGHWRSRIQEQSGREISLFVTLSCFRFADRLLEQVMLTEPRADARAASDAIDRLLVHRWLGLPIFGAVMYLIFWSTFTLGEVPMGWIESGFEGLVALLSGRGGEFAASPLGSLAIDGIIGGVGGVIVFLPNVLLLFLGLALLEDSGYMARAAFLMDRAMNRFGLHGKSFVPMVTGFGCSIPGIMATRTLENERDRLSTMLVLPLMSCGARLPIWMLLVPAFFAPQWRAPALFGIYAIGLALALSLALLLRNSLLRGEEAPFVMELPPYRRPTLRGVGMKVTERARLYVRKAGTIILGISIVMWCITTYPKKSLYEVDLGMASGAVQLDAEQIEHARAAEDLRHSIAGRIGGAIEPLLAPLGLDWRMGTAMIGAFAAKEVFVAQMGIVYSIGETDEQSVGLRSTLRRDYSRLSSVSLMLFLLISAPCMATIAVTRRESGRWSWALLQLGGLTAVGYLISLSVYGIGRLFV